MLFTSLPLLSLFLFCGLGNIMSDFPRFSIHSIQCAREQAYPQNAIGILVNRGNLAGRKTIWVRATMRKAPELFLLEVENIQPTILSAHPKQAGPITIDCTTLLSLRLFGLVSSC